MMQFHASIPGIVAKIWTSLNQALLVWPDSSLYGWTANYIIKWLSKKFPDDMQEITRGTAFDETEDFFERDEETYDEEC